MINKFLQNIKGTFNPELFSILRNGYCKKTFFADLQAGIIVGLVALPMAIAFGIASGVTPEQGIITAIIAGFLISFFGGSRVQIGGPTGAFIIIVYGIVQQFGYEGLLIATLIAGILLILMGIFKLGSIIKFIPYPIIVGFTSGIAVIIFSSQIKDLFGLQINSVPSEFISKWETYFNNFTSSDLATLLIGISTILIIIYFPKISKKIPGSLIAILFTTILVYIFQNIYVIEWFNGIETIGDRFEINASMPKPVTPEISIDTVRLLFPAAFTIAMLGAIESLLSAVVADGVTGYKHRSNTELIAQGIANIASPLFGGIPATGAIARTITNINNGGKTPVAGIIHAIVLLLIMLFFGKLAKLIPMSCLAGVLVIVAYNMSEWRTFKSLLKGPRSDVAVLLTTFLLTIIFDLTIAIEIGLLIAMLLFTKRVSETSGIKIIQDNVEDTEEIEPTSATEQLLIPENVEIYEIDGPFFFGIANKLDDIVFETNSKKPKVKIIRMRKVPFIDSTGIKNLETLLRKSKSENITMILSGVNKNVYDILNRYGFIDKIGNENVFDHISKALEKASQLVLK